MEKQVSFFTEILDFTDSRRQESDIVDRNLLWWSKRTKEEEHMLHLSAKQIKKTLLMAIFAFNSEDNQIIAAAGIFIPRTWNNTEPYLDNKKVVEIGTNFVLPEFRRHGIGTKLIELRLNYSKEKNWIPVSISSNKTVQQLFITFNGSLMENEKDCFELRELLCLRKCGRSKICNCCPLTPNCGWIFK